MCTTEFSKSAGIVLPEAADCAESHEAEVGADCGGAGRTVEDGLAIIFI